jgi:hypothetical protein
MPDMDLLPPKEADPKLGWVSSAAVLFAGCVFTLYGLEKLRSWWLGGTLENTVAGDIFGHSAAALGVLGAAEVVYGGLLLWGRGMGFLSLIGLSFCSGSIALLARELGAEGPRPCGCISGVFGGNSDRWVGLWTSMGIAAVLGIVFLILVSSSAMGWVFHGTPREEAAVRME